ncbi:hypothetical protein NQ317_001671 [Molorchus minor]|uniref:Uncharacterized protein n=1 Tax=Molorchus minor TaxID=1323400 RepID=A0ABQ9ISL4_9CUCU|nr:hypothetical protein NQ317_001671 [Molorchus minor]
MGLYKNVMALMGELGIKEKQKCETTQHFLKLNCYDVIAIEDSNRNFPCSVEEDMPSLSCSLVKYNMWEDVTSSDLGIWTTLNFAQYFVSRMRSSTLLTGLAIVLLLIATIFSFLGHCKDDSMAIIACGFFYPWSSVEPFLGISDCREVAEGRGYVNHVGLFLGTALVIFSSAISETLAEIWEYDKETPWGPKFDHQYGWCFFVAGLSFIMANSAALFSILAYLNRFSSVDDMVMQMVPGAKRKLCEHNHLSSDFLIKHINASTTQYDPLPAHSKYDTESGPLLNKTPPDVCSTNKLPDFGLEALDPLGAMASALDPSHSSAQTLAGQTIPIVIKKHNMSPPLSFSNLPSKYGTIHYSGGSMHQDFFGISGIEESTSFSDYYGKSKTLQQPRRKKKCVAIETFQVPESSFADFGGKRTNSEFGFSGSAV